MTVDVRSITEVTHGAGGQNSGKHRRSGSGVTSPSMSNGSVRSPRLEQDTNATLSISIVHDNNASVELIAPDASTHCEWVDGLNLLTEGFIVTQTSADFVQTLTDIGVKLRLLDITGERLEIPSSLPIPPVPPPEIPFYYAD